MNGESEVNAIAIAVIASIPVPIQAATPTVDVVLPPRTMNHMDPETRATHARLEAWGKWARDSGIQAWPKRTMLGRMIEEGPSGASQQGKPPIAMPRDVADVDAAVGHLGAIDKQVIQTYYLRWEPKEVMARRNSMRVRQFDNVLRRARWRITGYLAALNTASNW